MFDGITPTHLILLLGIVLIIFGPGRLPEIGNALGKGIRQFREASSVRDEPPPSADVPNGPGPTPPST